MDLYLLLMPIFGAVILLSGWSPLFIRNWPLSVPMIAVALGVALVQLPLFPLSGIGSSENRQLVERATEFARRRGSPAKG